MTASRPSVLNLNRRLDFDVPLVGDILLLYWIDACKGQDLSQVIKESYQQRHESGMPEQARQWQSRNINRDRDNRL